MSRVLFVFQMCDCPVQHQAEPTVLHIQPLTQDHYLSRILLRWEAARHGRGKDNLL